MAFLFLTTNTTGREEADSIIQLAFLYADNKGSKRVVSEVYKGEKEIEASETAKHHITNKMISNAQKISAAETAFSKLNADTVNKDSNIIVSHNLTFDMMMLERAGLENKYRLIDLKRVAKHVLDESDYSLNYLYYKKELQEVVQTLAHSFQLDLAKVSKEGATYNNLRLSLLFKHLGTFVTVDKMIELSDQPVLLKRFSFGKYKGHLIEKVAEEDFNYIERIREESEFNEDLEHTLNYYIKEGNNNASKNS